MSTNKQALREPVIIDISKHPLIKQAYEVCQAIEKCGASTELTDAVTKASALMQEIANAMALLDKWQQESSTWQSVAEKQLAIATEMEAKLQAAEKTSEARREAIDRTHKMYQREVERAESAESRIAELEAREVKLPPNELVTDTWTSPGDGWEVFDAQKVIDSIRSAGVRIAAGISVKGE